MVECPVCDGHGELLVETRSYWDRNIGGWIPEEVTRTCPECDGYQEVTPDVAEYIASRGGPPPYEDRDVVIYDTFLDQEERLMEAA